MSAPRRAALASALLAAGCASSGRSEDVLAVLRAQQQAWNRGDVRAFVELGYLDSPELCFFSGGEVTRGFDGLVERYQARYAAPGAEMGTLAFSALEVVLLEPEVALVRGRWALDRERLADLDGLFTLLLRRTEAGWRIVHDHTSAAE